MRRVLILGCAGAGKTTLGRALAAKTGLPLVHLDRHYWQPGWVEPDRADWTRQVEALAQEPAWILDGNYLGTLPVRLAVADTVLLLDTSRLTCLRRVLWRTLRDLGRTRADMPAGCVERFDWPFLRYVWGYPRAHRPRVLKALEGFGGRLVTLRSRRETERFLANLP